MKKKIIMAISILGVITSIIVLCIGFWLANEANKAVDGTFLKVFFSYFLGSIGCLIGTAIFTVFMMAICQIVDNLKELNTHLNQSKDFQLPVYKTDLLNGLNRKQLEEMKENLTRNKPN